MSHPVPHHVASPRLVLEVDVMQELPLSQVLPLNVIRVDMGSQFEEEDLDPTPSAAS